MTVASSPSPVRRQPALDLPRRRGLVLGVGLLIGLAVAVLWSAQLADDAIGVTTANGLLGEDASSANLTGTVTGLVFAFVTGLAGTFTACNVAVFSAVAPMLETGRQSAASRLAQALRPMGWIALGAAVVAGMYGAIGALLGSKLPQLSTATVGTAPVRVLQSIAVFGVIGLVMLYLGVAALGLVPDPLARASARTRQLVMGALVGGFLIGRPWPLFHKMFLYAASTHNAAFGAATFVLVVIGNMLVLGVLFLLLSLTPLPRWLLARPGRIAAVTSSALLIGGAFTVAYWCLRVPSHFGVGWFPAMPWH
ncbi:MAG TPA: hypothetical protein VL652_22155 [Kutzneria sp.]|nr:hypothetical protein [Kutzneria sp.]